MVSGSLRTTDTLYSTTAQFQILRAPTSSNGTTFGPGSTNNLLKSNGTSVYWTTLATSDIPTLSITDKTSGTLTVPRGGTGATDAAGARTNLGVKALQSNVSSPTANGNSISYIDTISQNTQGIISATKKTIPEVTQSESGLMIPDDKIKLDGIGIKKQVKTVSIEPVQDLHGQDAPYPPGGGKNKLPPLVSQTINGVTISVASDGTTTLNGTVTDDGIIDLYVDCILPSAQYVISMNNQLTIGVSYQNTYFEVLNSENSRVTANTFAIVNRSAVFTSDVSKVHYRFQSGVVFSNFVIQPQIESGSTPTTYAPYSNICPISGWTGANVTRTGFNVWDEEWEAGGYSESDGSKVSQATMRNKNPIRVIPSLGYYFNVGVGSKIRIVYLDESQNFISTQLVNINSVYTTPNNCHYINFNTDTIYGTTYNHDICINISDSAKNGTYEPGHVVTYPISWQSEAGTVYGGTLDVTTGLLTVDRASVSLTGDAIDANWSDADKTSIGFYMSANNWRRTNYPTPVVAGGLYDYCKIGTVYNSDIWWNARMLFTSGSFNRFEIRIPKNVLSSEDLAGGRAYLNAHPLQAVYKIAPQTYQLTPTEILLLTNEDNVWADTGEVTLQSYFTNNATNVVGVIDVSHGGTGVTTIANIQAGKDGDGNTISSTYLKLSGGTMHGDLLIQKSGGSNVQVGNTDTGTHCLLIASTGGAHGIYSSGYWNGSSYVVDGEWLICRTQGGNITINGDCTGNAATATKATQDSDGNTIKSTYLKLSGGTMTGTLSVNRTSDGEEANVEAKSAAGSIYLYSEGTNTGSRGIHAVNAAGTSVPVIGITQDNQTYFYGLASQNVFRSGDTMTGNLTVQKNSEAMIRVKNTAIGVDVAIDSKSDGNHGIWSYGYWDGSNYVSNEKWMLYRDTDGKIRFNDVIDVAHGGTGATTGNGACENINAVNSKTDSARRITSGSVNDAALGMVSYAGQNDAVTQKPYNSWFDVFTFKSVETNYTRQIAVPWFNNRSIAFRVQSNGTWSSWRYIATQTTEPTA